MQLNPSLVPAWIAVVVIGREFLVSGLRSIAASEGFTIEASELGKFKMVVQIVSVVAVILDHRWKEVAIYSHYIFPIHWIAYLAIWFMVCVSLASAVDYFVAFWSKIDQRVVKRRRRAFILSRRRKPVPPPAGGPRCRCLDLVRLLVVSGYFRGEICNEVKKKKYSRFELR